MFFPDVPPETPAHDMPVMIAELATDQSQQRVVGECHLIGSDEPLGLFEPAMTAYIYFKWFEDKEIGFENSVTLISGPEHGELTNYAIGKWEYIVTDGYIGHDNVAFLVDIDGYKVKLTYSVKIVTGILGDSEGYDPGQDPENCPNGKFWKIAPDGEVVPLKRIDVSMTSSSEIRI